MSERASEKSTPVAVSQAVRDGAGRIADTARTAVGEASETARLASESLRGRARKVAHYARRNPALAMLISLGIGYVVARTCRRG